MYWKSHATEVYVKGETFDHAGGKKAPYPTVRYTGTRGTTAVSYTHLDVYKRQGLL